MFIPWKTGKLNYPGLCNNENYNCIQIICSCKGGEKYLNQNIFFSERMANLLMCASENQVYRYCSMSYVAGQAWCFIPPIGPFILLTVNRFRHPTLIEQGLYLYFYNFLTCSHSQSIDIWVNTRDFHASIYEQMLHINAYAYVSQETGGLKFGMSLYLHVSFMCPSSKGSGESVHVHRLV